ncbi:MAG TPA: glycosyltransferase family 2 protein [Parachlamydiaceae bacterium]|nr:glycosyltransferase family 2 protein [Parachlamydiaceae bacterium]
MNKENPSPTIGCIIPTYKAKNYLQQCLMPLINSPLKPRILVVDSSSNDGTIELAMLLGAETVVIPQSEFNHGTTRELGRKILGTDIVCMLTQDAYLSDAHALHHLVAPIVEKKAKIAYARQVPHRQASFFESFPRHYNYPAKSQLRSIEDSSLHGVYTFFCSNSCAAYSNEALDEIGGFEKVLLGEDTVATAKILHKGHKIAYCAEAVAYHSHNYSLSEEFCRSFDTGLARKGFASLIDCGSSDAKRGAGYVRAMAAELLVKAPWLLPYAFAHAASKWSGYQIGSMSVNAPIWFKRALSSQKYYWSAKN